MTYPFVPAASDYGPRKGPVLAFVIHMAEGGGTVGFLSRPNQRGVSVHYVIEYAGRIVQMLRETRASGSINPNSLRADDGPPPFGASVAKAVLGLWWRDPNSAVLSVEIEGFAAVGPNVEQKVALRYLVDDLRGRYPNVGLLGHRDFQDYKACPGGHIPWDDIGGHGPARKDEPMITISVNTKGPYTVALKAGTQLYDQSFKPLVKVNAAASVPGYFLTGTGYIAVGITTGGQFQLAFAKVADVTYSAAPAGVPPAATTLAPGLYEVKP